jgi:hypothetical protein
MNQTKKTGREREREKALNGHVIKKRRKKVETSIPMPTMDAET